MGFHITGCHIEVKENGEWKHLKEFETDWVRGEQMRELMGVDQRSYINGEWKTEKEFESPVSGRGFPETVTDETKISFNKYHNWVRTKFGRKCGRCGKWAN